jgi:hypothetical protein
LTTMRKPVVAAVLVCLATRAGTATILSSSPRTTNAPPQQLRDRRRQLLTAVARADRRHLVDPYPCTTAEFCAQPNGICHEGYCKCAFEYGYDADTNQCLEGGCGDLGYFCDDHQVCTAAVDGFDQKTYTCNEKKKKPRIDWTNPGVVAGITICGIAATVIIGIPAFLLSLRQLKERSIAPAG